MTSTATETDPFATPSKEFVSIDHLDGRLVVVFPEEIRSRTGSNGKDYDYVIADVLVFDGPTTDLIPSLPHKVEQMHLSATAVVGALRAHVKTHRPVIGRIDSRPSTKNRNVKAYGMAEPTQADKDTARAATFAEMEARAAQADPFATAA